MGGAAADFSHGQSRFFVLGHSVMISPGAAGVHGCCIIAHSRHNVHISDPVVHNDFLITTHLIWQRRQFLLVSTYFRQSAFGLDVSIIS